MACCSINFNAVRPGEQAKTERLLRSLKFYPIKWEIAKQAGDLLNLWWQKNHTLSLPDTTIAAVAWANDLVLVTGNPKDFPMPELRPHTTFHAH